jgi:hypothetical protein
MNIESTPTEQDYNRLRRAMIGIFVILLVFVVGASINDFASNVSPLSEGLACLIIYGPCPIIAIVVLLRVPFSPQNDPTHQRFTKVAFHGPRLCVLVGLAAIGCGVAGFFVIDPAFLSVGFLWLLIAIGLSLVLWSFQFPKVALSEARNQEAKRWQFSLRALLAIPVIVALYLAVALWLAEPGEHVAWRYAKPFVILGLLSTAILFVVNFIVLPLRWTWAIVAKLLGRQKPAIEEEP